MSNVANGERGDPQMVTTGILKHSQRSDVITFSIHLALFEIICVVTIPEEGTHSAPVYVKFRVNGGRS